MDPNDLITCHGEARYCLRTYDDFTFAETHNSFSTPEDGIMGGINHLTGLQSQWEDGIRAFMLDPITSLNLIVKKRMWFLPCTVLAEYAPMLVW